MTDKLNIRNEEIFLPGLCRLDFSPGLWIKLQSVAEKITDWRYFVTLAASHGVAALTYNSLEKLDLLRFIPADETDYLRNSLLLSLSRNTRNTEMMKEVLKVLNRESIRTVLLKGMALEQMVYENRGLRQMTDVDVLVSLEDSLRAYKILINSGFTSFPLKSIFHKFIIPYTGKHLPTLTKNGFSLELHHELFGAGNNKLTKILLDSCEATDLGGEKVFIPEPQIFFLYLIRHLFLHEMNNESQLRLYTDLVVLIKKFGDKIINNNLLTYSEQAGMNEILAARLAPLRYFWDLSSPTWLNEFIDSRLSQTHISKFVSFLKSPKNNPPTREGKAWFYRNTIKDVPGLHRKIIFLLGDLFPTITFMKRRYRCNSGWKALIYYPHRFGKLLFLFRIADWGFRIILFCSFS